VSAGTVKVPSGWTVAPLKRFLRVQSGDMISAENEISEGVPIIGGNGVRGYTFQSNTKAPALVIGRVGAKCGCVHLIETDFWASEHAFVVYPQRSFDLRFGRYLLDYIDLNRFAIRTAQPLLNTEIVEGALSYWPPVRTQKEIADYLDQETSRLDTLIAEKNNLLCLLVEKRRALITSAIISGINSKVKLKESGVQWLGQIPEHWETRRVAYLFSERDERSQPHLPLLVVSINTGVTLRKFSDDRIENVAADASSYKVARKGDISFNGSLAKYVQAQWFR
jgi:type I restriction enzyme S subunit